MSLLKRVVVYGSITVLVLVVAGAALIGWGLSRATLDTAGEIDFVHPLAVPPLAESTTDGDGNRVFDLRAEAGEHDFGDGAVRTWGFNGAYLGPTLRAERGERVVVNVANELDEPTSVHWHGMRLPAEMDGGPHQPVVPGESWSPAWQVDQPAATLWYHPHPHGDTHAHVYRGLAGMFIVDDPDSADLDLPSEYGVDDIPVVVQDKRFSGDELTERAPLLTGGIGMLGDSVVVNGTLAPYLDVTTERVRLRLLNGSTARSYDFGFTDEREFSLIGTDGGLLGEPVDTSRVFLSPGERAEIVVTMRPGESTVLRSWPPDLGLDRISTRLTGGADTLDIMQLRAADQLRPSQPVPARLAGVEPVDTSQVAEHRRFELSDTSINNREMDMSRIDAVVTRDTVEVWTLHGRDGAPHNFHIHDVQFQVLSVDGAPPEPHQLGWQDTVYLPPGKEVRIAIPFGGDTNPDVPFMFHCHLLLHEDRGMMGQFVVVKPGERAGVPQPPEDVWAHHG